jgi:phosphatidylserine/phosphatidylglycerophosphate/cardiolipin synthase-like enzyme
MITSHVPFVEEGATYGPRPANRLEPLIGGERAFRRIAQAVGGARHSVWVTVAFLSPDFRFPDGRGHLFDLLDEAAARGLDVRALFWRSPEAAAAGETGIFQGTADDHAALARRGARFRARWDRLDKTYCHHQKSWLVDAGTASEVAFVGGINLNNPSVTSHPFPPRQGSHTQDIYCELAGPAATDVHHNFVQRWNGASERELDLGAWPSPAEVDDLPFPHQVSPPAGQVPVQLTRTVRRGFYRDATPTPGGKSLAVVEGEQSVLRQYLLSIDAAREGIYLENQAFLSLDVTASVERALARGVEVLVVVPGLVPGFLRAAVAEPRLAPTLRRVAALGAHPRFTLAALAASRAGGRYDEVYVHTKAAIVDDAWATIGSTNLANRSFYGDTELNAAFWHPDTVTAFRRELLGAHHGDPLDAYGLAAALRAFRARALENRERRERRAPLEGFAYALDPAVWLSRLG